MDKIYEVKLKTIGPVHIGYGRKINKGQYVYDKVDSRIYIPNENKMMSWIIKKDLVDSFEKYYMSKNPDLFSWFKANKLLGEFKDYMEYSLSTKSLKISGKIRLNDIELIIKDKDLSPYIPGSSLKGVIRTAIFGEYLYDLGRSETKDYLNDIRKYLNNKSVFQKKTGTKLF
ncbi:MAG: type III-A CRISPR-associated RAMP protein Csm5 [Tissierellia bacterium]|nr:type III-A CRISPR-associated RAMP protein Csm5 [Tissierellia bacterium]